MRTREYSAKWTRKGDWAPHIDAGNQISPGIYPTVAADSADEDSTEQLELREELKRSGLKICYQSRRDGNSELYVMDADGSNSINITNTPELDEIYPHISRDGRRVCFTVMRMEKMPDERTVPCFDIYWMRIDGNERMLVERDATDPCWDPDGCKIAFVKRLGREKTKDYQNTGLFAYDIRAQEIEELVGKLYHAYVPCWSPVGKWIVATVHDHAEFGHAIVAIDLQDKQVYSLEKCGINGCRPDLSWDGEFICWNPNDIQIGIAPFDPLCSRKLSLRAIAQAPAPNGSVYFSDWSPDGKYIAYSMNGNVSMSDTETRALWDIFVTRAEGGPYVQLTFDHANNKHPEFFLPT